MNLEYQILRIKDISPHKISNALGCCLSQARKFKNGESGLKNFQAFILKDKYGLEPEAFNELYISHKKRETEELNTSYKSIRENK